MPNIDLTGPVVGLAISLAIMGMFLGGKLFARNTVPREDLDRALAVGTSAVEKVGAATEAIKSLVAVIQALLAECKALRREVQALRAELKKRPA